MRVREISERWTIIGVSILVLGVIALLAAAIRNTKEQPRQLGLSTIQRIMDDQRWYLHLLTRTFEWTLNEEAQQVMREDTFTDDELLQRWQSTLISRYPINAIGLADERGDERILQRSDSMWEFTSTSRITLPIESCRMRWPLRRSSVMPPYDSIAVTEDPRETIWFSQALENRHGDPVWSDAVLDSNEENTVYLSLLVRSRIDGRPYHVVHMDINVNSMLTGLAQWTPELSVIHLSATGTPLIPLDSSNIGRSWVTALTSWRADRTTTPFLVASPSGDRIGQVAPYNLNGTKVHIGVMLSMAPIDEVSRSSLTSMWVMLGLLILLSILLIRVFIQSRNTDLRVRRQERRSKLQARDLAQVIGQREMLDREVHHRVKNNLQVVSSLLNLQAQHIHGKQAQEEFMRGKRRIDSMALVHNKLYLQSDLSAVDLQVLLSDLATAVAVMFEPESLSVSSSVDTGGIKIDADTSIQLGMILCELLVNCHQHAFPYATGGHIDIQVSPVGSERFRLTVKDNGKGPVEGTASSSHLGLEIVEALAEQLNGTMSRSCADGTTVLVEFQPQVVKPF